MLMRLALLMAMGLGTIVGFPGTAQADPYPVVILQGLDKITARVTTFKVPLNQTIRFGTLEIIARHCDKRPPTETPESAAFLEMWAVSPGRPTATVFRGWMFASSPALNALEHPVYDVWVLGCEALPGEAGETAETVTPETPKAEGTAQ